MVASKLSSFLLCYFPLFLQIDFVTHQDFGNPRSCMFVQTFYPSLHVLVGFLVCDVKGDYHALGLSVEIEGDGLEALLSRCVPNFHWDFVSILVIVVDLNVIHAYKR